MGRTSSSARPILTLEDYGVDAARSWRKSPKRPNGCDGQHGGILSRFWGADRSAPTRAKASRPGRRGAGLSVPILPQWRLVSNEFPYEIRAWIAIDRLVRVRWTFQTGLGESRTPTPFRTSAPKTDASAIPPRGPQPTIISLGYPVAKWRRSCVAVGSF